MWLIFHKMNWVELLLLTAVFGVSTSLQCDRTDVKKLLQDCKYLSGLVVTNRQGMVTDDSNCGELQPVLAFDVEPLYQYPLADSNTNYTLLFLDPDVPLQKEGEFFVHMIKTDIPGSALKAPGQKRTSGRDIKAYLLPTPLPGTGAHRYYSLLYRQADGNGPSPDPPLVRYKFVLADYLRGSNLCGPVASTMTRLKIDLEDPVGSLGLI